MAKRAKQTEKSYLTPNEAADLLMVSPITIRQWAKKGDLKALTTPGGHRRFLLQDVERFAKDRGIALRPHNGREVRVLVVETDDVSRKALVDVLGAHADSVVMQVARDIFDAGRKLCSFKPNVLVLDVTTPGVDAERICESLKEDPSTQAVRVIALAQETTKRQDSLFKAGAEAYLVKPLDRMEIIRAVGV